MLSTDEDALVCDLAETYHIYDYRQLPLKRVAVFAIGLRNDSRIKLKMKGLEYSTDTLLLASAVDRLSYILWSKTKDASSGSNKPKSILSMLLKTESKSDIQAFNTPEDFEKKRQEIIEKSRKGE